MPGSGARQRHDRRVAATVGVAGVAFVGVAVAAAGGPVPLAVEGTDAWTLRLPTVDADPPEPVGAEPAAARPVDPDSVGADIGQALAQVAVLLVVGALVYLVGRAVVRAVRLTSTTRLAELPPHEAPPTGSRAVAEAVDEGLEALAGGPVDDVIVACWVRLEDAAAAGGAGRRPSETPAELAVRVLEGFRAPPASVDRLLDLYRAARYSRHPLGEDDRAAAIAALADIRQAIGRVPA
jgi:hypothetical protein